MKKIFCILIIIPLLFSILLAFLSSVFIKISYELLDVKTSIIILYISIYLIIPILIFNLVLSFLSLIIYIIYIIKKKCNKTY